MSNEAKLTSIRALNIRQELPLQAPDDTIFNGAFFDKNTLAEDLFIVPLYNNFTHPLSDYPQEQQYEIIREYGVLIAEANWPRTIYVGVEDIEPNAPFFPIGTHEVNKNGYWTLVQRTVFLFRELPFFTTDFVAPSTVPAPIDHAENLQQAPSGIDYLRPADLGPPNAL